MVDSFVCVYLIEPRVHTVVPKRYVFDLNQVTQDNNGVNCNFRRRIFFSRKLFRALQNGENPNLDEYPPNFCLPQSRIFPLFDLEETCFLGKTIKYWRKYKKKKQNNIRMSIKKIYCLGFFFKYFHQIHLKKHLNIRKHFDHIHRLYIIQLVYVNCQFHALIRPKLCMFFTTT